MAKNSDLFGDMGKMSFEEMLADMLNPGAKSAADAMAATLFELYTALSNVGFTDEQSMFLLSCIVGGAK